MNNELLKIFDENRNLIGTATREEVHRLGHWHEAFHCWFVSKEAGKDYIYFQLRSHRKEDYPNLLDITAAGHLLAHESAEDGVREIQEEIGIDVSFDELELLDVMHYSVSTDKIIDREHAHVFMYHYRGTWEHFTLQEEEVSGMFRAEFNDFCSLWEGNLDQIRMDGFVIDTDGDRQSMVEVVGKEHFVQHEKSYYEGVINRLRRCLEEGKVRGS